MFERIQTVNCLSVWFDVEHCWKSYTGFTQGYFGYPVITWNWCSKSSLFWILYVCFQY